MPCFTTPKQLYGSCLTYHRIEASRRGTLSPCLYILTRLNHFSLRLRPAALRPSCLTFGVTSACPMLATRWMAYLAGTGISPTGIIDLARPHTPLIRKEKRYLRIIMIEAYDEIPVGYCTLRGLSSGA